MMKIRSIRVLSAAKVNAVLFGIVGLVLAPIVLLGPGLAMMGRGRRGFGAAVIAAALTPFLYAVIGFIIGALLAFIYNAISQGIGGLEVELEAPTVGASVPQFSSIPPAPQPDNSFVSPPSEPGSTDLSEPKTE